MVLAVNVWDEPKTQLQRFVKEKKLSHRVLLQGQSVAKGKYNLGPVPTTFWIDKRGKIVYQTFGFNEKELKDMEAWINRIIAS